MDELLDRAQFYSAARKVELISSPMLGAGTDGSVWQTRQGTAVKAFGSSWNFLDELECYRRFSERKVSSIKGLTIPRLEGYDQTLLVLELTIVKPPYLLDFGKVYLDRTPPYWNDEEVMAGWMDECRELFGPNYRALVAVLARLRSFGI
jgi:hypothetical protein